MISTCTECQARYQLDSEKIPNRKIRVRCPACSGVFGLDGTQAAATVDPVISPEPAFETSAPPAAPAEPVAANDDLVLDNGFETSVTPGAPDINQPVAEVASGSQAQASESAVAVLDKVEEAPVSSRRRRSKEEMLARALVSDILVYNRDLRDTAVAEGNLLEALGGEIKKSWELYKEKVTPEVANSTNHFRDALNEILAEGEKVF